MADNIFSLICRAILPDQSAKIKVPKYHSQKAVVNVIKSNATKRVPLSSIGLMVDQHHMCVNQNLLATITLSVNKKTGINNMHGCITYHISCTVCINIS